jgi:hypothetical protein
MDLRKYKEESSGEWEIVEDVITRSPAASASSPLVRTSAMSTLGLETCIPLPQGVTFDPQTRSFLGTEVAHVDMSGFEESPSAHPGTEVPTHRCSSIQRHSNISDFTVSDAMRAEFKECELRHWETMLAIIGPEALRRVQRRSVPTLRKTRGRHKHSTSSTSVTSS